MEVVLKKTKLTNSIMSQVLTLQPTEKTGFSSLGFCVYKKTKWIVLYNEDNNELRKYPMFTKVEKLIDHSPNPFQVRVTFPTFVARPYTLLSDNEVKNLISFFNSVKDDAIDKGQIFL